MRMLESRTALLCRFHPTEQIEEFAGGMNYGDSSDRLLTLLRTADVIAIPPTFFPLRFLNEPTPCSLRIVYRAAEERELSIMAPGYFARMAPS